MYVCVCWIYLQTLKWSHFITQRQLPQRSNQIGPKFVGLCCVVVGRHVDLHDASGVSVVLHQHPVHVASWIGAVVVLPDFQWEVIGLSVMQISNGKVTVLPRVLDHRQQRLRTSVHEWVKSILSFCWVTLSHHIVVQAPLNVPLQQHHPMARRGSTKSAEEKFLLWV